MTTAGSDSDPTDVILICTGEDALRRRLLATLRREYPARTADDPAEAVDGYDRAVSVLVVDHDHAARTLDELDRRVLDDGDASEATAEGGAGADDASGPPEVLALARRGGSPADPRITDTLHRPIDEEELRRAVGRLRRRARYDRLLRRYYATAEEYAAAATRDEPDSERLGRLRDRLGETRAELDELAAELDYVDAFEVATDPFEDDFAEGWGDLDI